MKPKQRRLNRWTVDDVMAEGPCYSRGRVLKLWRGRKSLTLRQVLALPIPPAHHIWLALRPRALPRNVYSQWHAAVYGAGHARIAAVEYAQQIVMLLAILRKGHWTS